MRVHISILLGLLSLFSRIEASTPITEPWQMKLLFKHGSQVDTLRFGTHVGATNGFDLGIDKLTPPTPPTTDLFFAYFEISGIFNCLQNDFRSNLDSTITWTLDLVAPGDSTFELSWDPSTFPTGDIPGSLRLNTYTDMLKQNKFIGKGVAYADNFIFFISYSAPQKATFVSVTIGTNPKDLYFQVDSGSYTQTAQFNWPVGSRHNISTTLRQLVSTGSSYVFQNWSDSGARYHQITVAEQDMTLQANFVPQFQISGNISPAGSGRIELQPQKEWYDIGETVTLKAIAQPGFKFEKWTGTFTSTAALVNLIMDQYHQTTAVFTSATQVPHGGFGAAEYGLQQNYPNPFNNSTDICFSLAEENDVQICVYNDRGELVSILVDQKLPPGSFTTSWQAGAFSTGVYYCTIRTGAFFSQKPMLLIK